MEEKSFDEKSLWPEDLKQREEQWQRNGGPVTPRRSEKRPPSPPMPPPVDDKRRTRSRSRERRRSRSRSRSPSPNDRFRRRADAYDYRRRQPRRSPDRRFSRREHSRERNRSRNRSRSRDRRDRSHSRGRMRRGDWSPKGRRRTPAGDLLEAPPPPNINQAPPPPYIPQPLYGDGYNYSAPPPYGQNMPPQQYGGYDFPGQGPPQQYVPPPYPPPPPILMPPGGSGDDFAANVWGAPPPPMGQQQQQQQPMPPQISIPVESEEEKSKREAAVAQEMQNQRATLKKQREDYQRRASALTRELKILKEQRNKLAAVNQPHSPTTRNFLKENDRLQSQIQNKLSNIENVIAMLSGIIGVEKTPSPPSLSTTSSKSSTNAPKGKTVTTKASDSDESDSEKLKSKLIQSMKKNKKEKEPEISISRDKLLDPEKKINYVFYDPEMHWCSICNVFPKSAKDYLNHLHSKEHINLTKNQESPWHDKVQIDEFPNYPNAPSKRTPIRGLQFFTPATAWYCKLCSIWMGDLHCASTHLKSRVHADNYNAYSDQNPHFDMDWMADRQKAYDAFREKFASSGRKSPSLMHVIPLQSDEDSEKKHKKKKKKQEAKKDKKKRKRGKRRRQSSSSSSSSTSSDTESESDKKEVSQEVVAFEELPANSIRVSMRNMTKSVAPLLNDDTAVGKWTMVQPAQVSSHHQTPFAPPAPSISTEAKKRDELIISQWTPGPVISESERKLLDDLKGKLKKKTEVDPDERRRSRERSPDRRGRRRSRSRGRYSRSRSKSPYYNRYGRRRSSSRNRRSSSRGRRSNSRGRRVIEKAVVNYPPEPKRLSEKKTKGKGDGNGERKKSPPKRKLPAPAKGKLPFIGRMPVFKKQVAAEDAAKQKEAEAEATTAQAVPKVAKATSKSSSTKMPHGDSTMDDELMPDPRQYMVLLSGGGAPPPPPSLRDVVDKNEEVLPPGIDEAEADLVPKPISDAPRPRKGPLPKDFQDALDLIFPDENKKREAAENRVVVDANREPVDMEGVTAGDSMPEGVLPAGEYSAYAAAFPGGTQAYAGVYEGLAPGVIQTEVPPPIVPPPPPIIIDMDTGNSGDGSIPHVEMAIMEESKDSSSANKIELDDLALLGIDADDMAAQCM